MQCCVCYAQSGSISNVCADVKSSAHCVCKRCLSLIHRCPLCRGQLNKKTYKSIFTLVWELVQLGFYIVLVLITDRLIVGG
jgi:hypothetical protein